MKGEDDSTTAGRVFDVMRKILATAAIPLILVASSWAAGREKILYSFQGGSDGTNPIAGLVFDAQGNLYGTSYIGGNGSCLHGCGIVFKLTANKSGSWTETILHQFGPRQGA